MTDRLCGAPLVGSCEQVHLFEDHGQRRERCIPLKDSAAHHSGTESNSAAVPQVGCFHLWYHVLEGVKLQEAVDKTIVAKVYCVPVGAQNWLVHDRSATDLTSHQT